MVVYGIGHHIELKKKIPTANETNKCKIRYKNDREYLKKKKKIKRNRNKE